MPEPTEGEQIVTGGGFIYQTEAGNFVTINDPEAGTVSKETPESRPERKKQFLASLDQLVDEGKIPPGEKQHVLLKFLEQNPQMLSEFEIR